MLPILLPLTQDPNLSAHAKNQINRYSLDISGVDQEKIDEFIPKTWEEMDAEEKLPLLDANDSSGAKIDNMNVDHSTYIEVFSRASDTPAKFVAIQARKRAMIEMGQNQLVNQGQQQQ